MNPVEEDEDSDRENQHTAAGRNISDGVGYAFPKPKPSSQTRMRSSHNKADGDQDSTMKQKKVKRGSKYVKKRGRAIGKLIQQPLRNSVSSAENSSDDNDAQKDSIALRENDMQSDRRKAGKSSDSE